MTTQTMTSKTAIEVIEFWSRATVCPCENNFEGIKTAMEVVENLTLEEIRFYGDCDPIEFLEDARKFFAWFQKEVTRVESVQHQAISESQAVIGWTLGSRISSFRWNVEARPVCTIELAPTLKVKAHPINKPLGFLGI